MPFPNIKLPTIGIEGNFHNRNKGHLWKINIILDGERLNAFPVISETKQMPSLPASSVLPDVYTVKLGKKMKRHLDWQRRSKTLFIWLWNDFQCKKPNGIYKDMTNWIYKASGYKVNVLNPIVVLYTSWEQSEIALTIASKICNNSGLIWWKICNTCTLKTIIYC